MVGYGVANLGANLAYAFANFAFPLFLTAYPIPIVLVGFLAQERSFVGGFVQPFIGALSDRLPPNRLGRRRPFFLVGVPLTAASLIFLSTYPALWAVVAIMTVFSFFLAIAYIPYLALLADIAPSEQRGRVGGVMAVFTMLGTTAVAVLAYLFWNSQQAVVFWAVAIGIVLSFAVTSFAIREPAAAPSADSDGTHFTVRAYIKELSQHRELLKYMAVMFFFWLGNGGLTPFLTRFGVEVLGLAANTSFLLLAPAIVGAAFFAIPAGISTERFGKKPVLAVGLFLFGLMGVLAAQFAQPVSQAPVLMLVAIPVAMLIIGIANAITTTLLIPLLMDLIPETRAGELTGVGSLVASLAQPIGAVIAGGAADLAGTLRWAFFIGGAAMLLSLVILLSVDVARAMRDATH
jgi:Na+/melibiose symporter-like transporter